ncbi:hypothetical protein CFAM422_009453 [Trichoderma lentiforme]|uniref:Uncharacterized protein n=1 Tax=Trichoderma lentiforme TaxID=1567552 RepID=A0A9P4XA26_9HYPO|nr:hypothetical protein CFAM422_009453 [Trichoderma lentiforme]
MNDPGSWQLLLAQVVQPSYGFGPASWAWRRRGLMVCFGMFYSLITKSGVVVASFAFNNVLSIADV